MKEYIWKLFLNFTKTKKVIWINKKQIKYLRQIKHQRHLANVTFADKIAKIADDGRVQPGEYTRLLLLQHNSMKLGFAEEFEWEISKEELDALKGGKGDKKTGVACHDYWDCKMHEGMCTFGGNMVLDYHEDDDSEVKEEDAVVGFFWRLSSVPKSCSEVLVDVELCCPQIGYYVQFFDIEIMPSDRVTPI